MNDETYLELKLEFLALKAELGMTLEEFEVLQGKYYAMMEEVASMKMYIQNHNDVCPMGGLGG